MLPARFLLLRSEEERLDVFEAEMSAASAHTDRRAASTMPIAAAAEKQIAKNPLREPKQAQDQNTRILRLKQAPSYARPRPPLSRRV
jgi:hypothetical protein